MLKSCGNVILRPISGVPIISAILFGVIPRGRVIAHWKEYFKKVILASETHLHGCIIGVHDPWKGRKIILRTFSEHINTSAILFWENLRSWVIAHLKGPSKTHII